MRAIVLTAAALAASLATLGASLPQARSEPNLEKRSDLAMDNAHLALDKAREAYKAGDIDATKTALDEVNESVDLSYDSLANSGKDPHKSGAFKRAEMKARELMRRLDGLKETAAAVDQEIFDALRSKVSSIHDDLLNGILIKRKK